MCHFVFCFWFRIFGLNHRESEFIPRKIKFFYIFTLILANLSIQINNTHQNFNVWLQSSSTSRRVWINSRLSNKISIFFTNFIYLGNLKTIQTIALTKCAPTNLINNDKLCKTFCFVNKRLYAFYSCEMRWKWRRFVFRAFWFIIR